MGAEAEAETDTSSECAQILFGLDIEQLELGVAEFFVGLEQLLRGIQQAGVQAGAVVGELGVRQARDRALVSALNLATATHMYCYAHTLKLSIIKQARCCDLSSYGATLLAATIAGVDSRAKGLHQVFKQQH